MSRLASPAVAVEDRIHRWLVPEGSAKVCSAGRMSLPDQMADRWLEPAPGEGVVSWHMLMLDYPEVVDLAARLSSG